MSINFQKRFLTILSLIFGGSVLLFILLLPHPVEAAWSCSSWSCSWGYKSCGSNTVYSCSGSNACSRTDYYYCDRYGRRCGTCTYGANCSTNCGSSYLTNDYRCSSSNQLERYYHSKGCSGGSCYDNASWQWQKDCSYDSGSYNIYRCSGNIRQQQWWYRNGCSGSNCYYNTNNWSYFENCGSAKYCADSYCQNCPSNQGNCDGIASNGCETSLNDIENCGSCGNLCPAGKKCVSGKCACEDRSYSACFGNDLYWYNSCGARQEKKEDCGISGYCSGGACQSCSSNQGNCDQKNGDCEADFNTDEKNCGSCNYSCPLGFDCVGGSCKDIVSSGGYNGEACCETTEYCEKYYEKKGNNCFTVNPPTCSVSCGNTLPGDCLVTGKICKVTDISGETCTGAGGVWGEWINCSLDVDSGKCAETRYCDVNNAYQIRECACGSPTPLPSPSSSPPPQLPNNAPVAGFSCDASLCGPGSSSVNCIGYHNCLLTADNLSYDPDGVGDISSVVWKVTDKASGVVKDELSCPSGALICDYTMPSTLPIGVFIVQVTITDAAGESRSASREITMRRDIGADFVCSVDNVRWQACGSVAFKPTVGTKVYFNDNLSDGSLSSFGLTGRKSTLSEGATKLIKKVWKKDGVAFDSCQRTSGCSNFNPSSKIEGTIITLEIEDDTGRTGSGSENLITSLPMPEWEEISPF